MIGLIERMEFCEETSVKIQKDGRFESKSFSEVASEDVFLMDAQDTLVKIIG